MKSKPKAVTIQQAAAMLGLGKSYVYQLAISGKLPTVGHWPKMVPVQALERLVATGKAT